MCALGQVIYVLLHSVYLLKIEVMLISTLVYTHIHICMLCYRRFRTFIIIEKFGGQAPLVTTHVGHASLCANSTGFSYQLIRNDKLVKIDL